MSSYGFATQVGRGIKKSGKREVGVVDAPWTLIGGGEEVKHRSSQERCKGFGGQEILRQSKFKYV